MESQGIFNIYLLHHVIIMIFVVVDKSAMEIYIRSANIVGIHLKLAYANNV